MASEQDGDGDGGEVAHHVEKARTELEQVDWSQQPMAVRRLGEIADSALSHAIQEASDDE